MDERSRRLIKLADTLDRLRESLSARISELASERASEMRRRERLEYLLSRDDRFTDLTLNGGLRRLDTIAKRVSAIDQETEGLRRRSADAFLKAKRARQAASARASQAVGEEARLALAELVDSRTASSLRQATKR